MKIIHASYYGRGILEARLDGDEVTLSASQFHPLDLFRLACLVKARYASLLRKRDGAIQVEDGGPSDQVLYD